MSKRVKLSNAEFCLRVKWAKQVIILQQEVSGDIHFSKISPLAGQGVAGWQELIATPLSWILEMIEY